MVRDVPDGRCKGDAVTSGLRDRIHGAVLGQAVGDALGAPTEGMARVEIRERFGRVTDFLTEDQAGTDDSEYAALTAQTLLRYGPALTAEDVSAEWARVLVSQEGGFAHGGFSEMDAIHNLAAGRRAPVSGSDNHEMWSDGSAMRVAPIGAYCAGDPKEAARLAAIDASVSHARDGIWCGQAIAAGVATAIVADDWREVVESGLAAVPPDSWSARTIAKAIAIATGPGDTEARLDALEAGIALHHYPWSDVAPEATALAFGAFAVAEGVYVDAVVAATNLGRDADTIAAMAGAMAGGLGGAEAIPLAWRERVSELRGECIKAMAGVSMAALADAIADDVERRTRDGIR
jgi:ADP-ribosylglycohydrolase